MLKGFVAGSLALIMLYVVVQPGASGKTALASNALVQGFRRLFSPQVAGIGDHSKTTPTGASSGSTPANPASASPDAPQGSLFTL